MRRIIINGIMSSVFGLLAQQILQAQGTTYLSNLDQSSVGSLAVGSNSWLAGIFETGTNPGGYVLNSIQLVRVTGGFAGGVWTSSNGSSPWAGNEGAFPQFAINGSAVPEPGVLSLFVLGGCLLVWHGRKAKAI
jgi:hypothetical protein